MDRTNPDAVIGDYLRAFRAANPKCELPDVAYERGWYVFRGPGYVRGRYRRAQLRQLEETLRERARERVTVKRSESK